MAGPITNWLDDRIRVVVDEAMKDAEASILAEVQAVEKRITAQITLLPGLLGSQIQNVAVDAGVIATKIIQGVLQGIPNILNPFKGSR